MLICLLPMPPGVACPGAAAGAPLVGCDAGLVVGVGPHAAASQVPAPAIDRVRSSCRREYARVAIEWVSLMQVSVARPGSAPSSAVPDKAADRGGDALCIGKGVRAHLATGGGHRRGTQTDRGCAQRFGTRLGDSGHYLSADSSADPRLMDRHQAPCAPHGLDDRAS